MVYKSLRQVVTFRAKPKAVYHALMDSRSHSEFTGAKARIGSRPGAAFSAYDGSLSGIIVDLVPDRRIVLAWRADSWAEGDYSIARFTLTPAGKGTRVVFEQFGIPSFDYAGVRDGWRDFYWEPMRQLLEP